MNIPKDLADRIKKGAVGVIPTDTIYGIVASALDENAVDKVYSLKLRDPDKPFIILLGSPADMEKFGVAAEAIVKANSYWPGATSLIVPVKGEQWRYLHRGTYSLAFRVPELPWLRKLLQASGAIVAPSANPEGQVPAKNINEAREYFGSEADFYLDGGDLGGEASKIISLLGDRPVRLR